MSCQILFKQTKHFWMLLDFREETEEVKGRRKQEIRLTAYSFKT